MVVRASDVVCEDDGGVVVLVVLVVVVVVVGGSDEAGALEVVVVVVELGAGGAESDGAGREGLAEGSVRPLRGLSLLSGPSCRRSIR